MSSLVIPRFRALEQRKGDIIKAMQLSAHNTLYYPHFSRGAYFASNIEENPAYGTAYNYFPLLSIPSKAPSAYTNPRSYAMEPLSREELERFQKLSNDYEAEVPVRFLSSLCCVLSLILFSTAGSIGITKTVESSHIGRVHERGPNLCYKD
jgi:hypothetical protein